MAADIQQRRKERKRRRGTEHREEAMREEITHSAEEIMAKKLARTDRRDSKMDTEAGGERQAHLN